MSRDYTALRAKFRAELVAKVAPFRAQNDIRYYLNSIRVEAAGDRPGVYLVGCDGCRMMVAYDKDGMIEGDDGLGVIIKAPDAFVRACRTKPYKGFTLDVLITGRRVSVAPGWGGMFGYAEVYVAPGTPFFDGGKYPNWRRVIPDFDKLKPGIVNAVQARYLADYAKLSPSDKWGAGTVRFWQEASNAQIVVQMPAHPELVGVLMPMRDDLPHDALIQRMRGVIGARREVAK
jgi:hypothetical protein